MNHPPHSEKAAAGDDARPRAGLIALIAVGGMLAVVGAICPAALWVVVRDGPLAALILLASLGLGFILLSLIRLVPQRCFAPAPEGATGCSQGWSEAKPLVGLRPGASRPGWGGGGQRNPVAHAWNRGTA